MYKHTSPSGKVYIGITKDVRHRWRANGNGYNGSTRFANAIKKYGWDDFTHEILLINLTREEASREEQRLIKQYNSTDIRYGYNLESGGIRNKEMNEESRKKLSQSLLGHEVPPEQALLSVEHRHVHVKCIETGEIFVSGNAAAKAYGVQPSSINRVCSGKIDTCKGLHFVRLKDEENNIVPKFVPKKNPNIKPVVCVETGEKYKNVCEASRVSGLNRRAIAYAITKGGTSGGFHWKCLVEEEM